MNDKNKAKALKIAIVGLLGGISIVAIIGINVMLNKNNTENTMVTDTLAVPETEVVVEDIEPTVIEIEVGDIADNDYSEEEQQLQEEPDIPVAPTEAPELEPDTDLTNPDVVPEYVPSEPEPVPEVISVVEPAIPADDGSHPGQLYVPGFGWIEDIGPGTVTYEPDLYPNGNIVGEM